MKSDFQKYLDENIVLSNAKDKNTLFYIFTAAKMKSGSQPETLKEDFELKNVLKVTEKFCKRIGTEAVHTIAETYKPIQIMLELGDGSKEKSVVVEKIRTIMDNLRKKLLEKQTNFSEYYKIKCAFEDFTNSKEMTDFFESLPTTENE